MILTKKAIKKINVTRVRLIIALEMGFTEQWVIKLIDANKGNGPLTTAKAIQVIKQETDLTDSDILEEENEHESVK